MDWTRGAISSSKNKKNKGIAKYDRDKCCKGFAMFLTNIDCGYISWRIRLDSVFYSIIQPSKTTDMSNFFGIPMDLWKGSGGGATAKLREIDLKNRVYFAMGSFWTNAAPLLR